MKILIVQPRRIGDVLLATPVLRYVKQNLPRARTGFLLEKSVVPLLDGNPFVDEVIVYDKDRSWAEIKRVRSMRFDVVLDFMSNPRTSYLALGSGAPWRAGWAKWPRRIFYNVCPQDAVPEYSPLRKIRLTKAVFKAMGITPSEPQRVRPDLFLTESERDGARRWMRTENVASREFVIIAPAYRHVPRGWSVDKYREVALQIIDRLNKKVFLFWGPGEEPIMAAVRKGVEDRIGLLPRTSLREMAAVFEQAVLVVTNDSGAMHTAVAVDTPTVTMYGPTRPIDWNPSLAGAGPWDVPMNMNASGAEVFAACEKTIKEKTYESKQTIR